MNNNIMFKLNYLHGSIDKTAFAINAANANLVPAGNVGANFDAVAMRMQVAF